MMGSLPSVVKMLREGLIFDFHSTLPLSQIPLINSGYQDAEINSPLNEAVDKMLVKGSIEPVTDIHYLGFYSNCFLFPRKEGV